MGEVDTKPIKSVQASLSLFEEKIDRTKDRMTISDEMERDEELEGLLKGLSNLKVQIESKEFANKQAFLKIDQYEKQANELSSLLKNSEIEKEKLMNECIEAHTRVHKLESIISELGDSLNEELKNEKEKNEELLECVTKLNEDIVHLKIGANDRDKEMCTILAEKDDNLKLRSSNAEDKLEDTKKEAETNESEIDVQSHKKSDQSDYIKLLETELNRLRLELKDTKEEENEKPMYTDYEKIKIELEKLKIELEKSRERENKAQEENAILKSEIRKGKSMIVEAETVQERLKSENSSLYIAVKQLGLEVEETKNENRILRKVETKSKEEIVETSDYVKISKEKYEELETLKNNLENANVKIGELRARAEQAATRADMAELGKAKLEDRITRWRERKERRKKAIAGLRVEMIPEESTSYSYGISESVSQVHKTYQPLGKVLNMKF